VSLPEAVAMSNLTDFIGASTKTLNTSLNALKTFVNAATNAATAGTLVLRDSNARASFGDPINATQAATKNYVDSNSVSALSLFGNSLLQGFVAPSLPTANLTAVFVGINGLTILVVNGVQVSIADGDGRLTHTYTASKDTYIDVSAAGAFTYVPVANNSSVPALTAGCTRLAKVVSGASTITGVTIMAPSYAIVGGPLVNHGRIYLAPNSPYGQPGNGSTLYFGPCFDLGNQISLWDATLGKWITRTFSEIQIPLTGLTTGSDYEIWVHWDYAQQNVVGEIGTVWSNSTTPPTRDTQDSHFVKHSDPTRLLVGSIKAINATGTSESSGTSYVSNVYNAVPRYMRATDTSSGPYSYGGTSPRAAHGDTTDGVNRVSFLQAVAKIPIVAMRKQAVQNNTAGQDTIIGIGLDSVTVPDSVAAYRTYATNTQGYPAISHNYAPQLGDHYIQAMEFVNGGVGSFFTGATVNEMTVIIWN
jgi:hypothetical protein